MKTSKRLLSILLMLTMLVSMFTVMASAAATDDTTDDTTKTVTVIVGENGTVGVGSRAYDSTFTAKEGDTLVANPAQGYEAVWYYGTDAGWFNLNQNHKLDENGNLTLLPEYMNDNCSFKVEFIKKAGTSGSDKLSLTVKVVACDVAGAKVSKGTTEITTTGTLTLKADEILEGKKNKLSASATGEYGKDYTVEWKLDGWTVEDDEFTLPKTLESGKTLTVTFKKAAPAPVKYTLTLNQTTGGTIKCGNNSTEVKLAKGETAKLTATPKEGYIFKKWEVVSSDTAIIADAYEADTTITMGDNNATVKAVFVKTYTLTIEVKTIDGKTPGKVTYDGREISSFKNQIEGATIELKAEAKSEYKFVKWEITGTGATVTGKENATVKIGSSDVKLTAVFAKKTYTDDLDLTIKVSGFSDGDVEYKYNDGKVTDLEKRTKTWTLDDEDEYVKFWLYPRSGYKAVVQFNDGKKYTYSYNESLTIDYEDLDNEDGTLYVSFVKKGSTVEDDYPTLTFDITGEKYGKVYRGTREYENGDVISIKKNDKMTFKAKVTKKNYVAVWTYKGDTYVGDEFTVKMGSTDAKLYVEFMDKDDIRLTELPFRDVSKRDWYYDDVVYVYRNGYMDGMSSTRFGGELNTTRGQIVTILWRLTGEPRATKRSPFNDVPSSQYYYDAVCWAYDAGVVDGFDAHTFKPDQNVTREQLAAILYRYAEYMNLSTGGSAYLGKYNDENRIANWAYDAMAWANYHGIINGTSATRISPKGYATRAQIAAMLHRFAVEFGA